MIDNISWPTSHEAVRLFHGRGHFFPGYEHITVDWYSPVVLITCFDEPDVGWLEETATALKQGLEERSFSGISVVVQFRCRLGAPFETLIGEASDEMAICEDGLKYRLRLFQNQNTGLFLDMANGRRWVREHAEGKRVLNLFAYTCAFSVAAVAGGAESVLNVDMAKGALSTGRDNHRLNGQALSQVRFEGVDIFRSWGRIRRHGPYDLLICDPPTFQKGSVDIARDYARILRRLDDFMLPGADMLLCLNAQNLDEEFLRSEVSRECPGAELVAAIPAPEVFREAMPGRGLKVLHYRYWPDQNGLKSSNTE